MVKILSQMLFSYFLTFFLTISQDDLFTEMNDSQNVTTSFIVYPVRFPCAMSWKLCAKTQKLQKPEMLKRRTYDFLFWGNEFPNTHGSEAASSIHEAHL